MQTLRSIRGALALAAFAVIITVASAQEPSPGKGMPPLVPPPRMEPVLPADDALPKGDDSKAKDQPKKAPTDLEYAEQLLKKEEFAVHTDPKKRIHLDDAKLFTGDLASPVDKLVWHYTAFVYGRYRTLPEQRQLKAVTDRELLLFRQFRFLVKNAPKGTFLTEGKPLLKDADALFELMRTYYSEAEVKRIEKAYPAMLAAEKSRAAETAEGLIAEEARITEIEKKGAQRANELLARAPFDSIVKNKLELRMHIEDAAWMAGPVWDDPEHAFYNWAAMVAVTYRSTDAAKRPKLPTRELLDWWKEYREIVKYEPGLTFRRTGSGRYNRKVLDSLLSEYFTKDEFTKARDSFLDHFTGR